MNKEEDICPFCGGTDIWYEHLEWLNEDSIELECHCKNCNHWFQQIYSTKFEGQDYDSEEYDEYILDNEQSSNN